MIINKQLTKVNNKKTKKSKKYYFINYNYINLAKKLNISQNNYQNPIQRSFFIEVIIKSLTLINKNIDWRRSGQNGIYQLVAEGIGLTINNGKLIVTQKFIAKKFPNYKSKNLNQFKRSVDNCINMMKRIGILEIYKHNKKINGTYGKPFKLFKLTNITSLKEKDPKTLKENPLTPNQTNNITVLTLSPEIPRKIPIKKEENLLLKDSLTKFLKNNSFYRAINYKLLTTKGEIYQIFEKVKELIKTKGIQSILPTRRRKIIYVVIAKLCNKDGIDFIKGNKEIKQYYNSICKLLKQTKTSKLLSEVQHILKGVKYYATTIENLLHNYISEKLYKPRPIKEKPKEQLKPKPNPKIETHAIPLQSSLSKVIFDFKRIIIAEYKGLLEDELNEAILDYKIDNIREVEEGIRAPRPYGFKAEFAEYLNEKNIFPEFDRATKEEILKILENSKIILPSKHEPSTIQSFLGKPTNLFKN